MPKKIYAHKMPGFRISIDNAAPSGDYYARWLTPAGEGGKYDATGGYLRDAALPLQPGELGAGVAVTRPLAGDYELIDYQVEVDRAKAMGFDGFTALIQIARAVSPAANYQDWDRQKKLHQAAKNRGGFDVMICPDMSTSFGNQTASVFADAIAELIAIGGCARLSDGRVIISPYLGSYSTSSAHQRWSATFWNSVFSALSAAGHSCALIPMPNGLSTEVYNIFDPLTYLAGYSIWGERNPGTVGSVAGLAAAMRSRIGSSKVWMHPVSAWDSRPTGKTFDENNGSQQLRTSLTQLRAEATGADDLCQVLTWDDYYEHSHVAPSRGRVGTMAGDLLKVGIAHWKTGSPSALTRETMHVLNRRQISAPIVLLSGTVTAGVARTTVPVQALSAAQAAALTVNSQWAYREGPTVTVTAQPATGATSVTVASYTPTVSYAAGQAVTKLAWTHRPSVGSYFPMVNRRYIPGGSSNSTATVDIVECLTYFSASATVTPYLNGVAQTPYTAAAGEHIYTTPAQVGTWVFKASRSSVEFLSATSAGAIEANPSVQDAMYVTSTASVAIGQVAGPQVASNPNVALVAGRSPRKIYLRADTAANLAAANTYLGASEMCREYDTGRIKTGPGNWNSLHYLDEHILASAGIVQPQTGEWLHPSHVAGNGTTGTPTVGTVYFVPLNAWPRGFSVQKLGLFCNGAHVLGTGGAVTNTIAIYGSNSLGRPLLTGGPLASGTIDSSTTGNKSVDSLTATVKPPRAWLAFLQTTAGTITTAPTFSCIGNTLPLASSAQPGGTVQKYWAALGQTAMPTTNLTLVSASGLGCPMLQAQVVIDPFTDDFTN